MAECIERKAALDAVHKWCDPCGATVEAVLSVPAADAAPVVHARWIERPSLHAMGGISAKCSACSKRVQYLGNPLNYCPNCGARMDGGEAT